MRFFNLLIIAALATPSGWAGELHFSSGANRVSLIELFTSEGCSSCPPADRWLGALRTDQGLWRDYVPVEFHVNYWDNLGWKDRLSSPAFTARQYAHASDWGTHSVYTPCFVRDGAEWHPNSRPPAPSTEAVGILEVDLDGANGRVHWTPALAVRTGKFDVHVAILGGGLVSRVTAGENRGSTLAHEFVALGLGDHPLGAADGGMQSAEFVLPPASVPNALRRAFAVWVTRRDQLIPIQATGGWLGDSP
jgi:hypothetical protein